MGYGYINVTSCLATGIALTAATVVVVALRLGVAGRQANGSRDARFSKYLDDLFCLLALLPTIGISTVMIYGAAKGIIGGHNDPSNVEGWINSTTPELVILEKCVYMIFIMQPLAIGLTKLAFLFLYRRIFTWPSFQWTSLVFVILTVAFTIAFFLGFIFDCRLNFAANWGSLASITENCPFGFEATIAFTVFDAFLDLCILLLPLPWIWRLQIPTIRKIQLCGVFLLGGFAVTSAVVRMVICIKQNTPSAALNQQYIMGMPTYDIIGITSHGLFWTVVETNVALIACCLLKMRPVFSISGLGSLMVSIGCLLQKVGSSVGTRNSKSATSGSGKFSKISAATVLTIGSTPRVRVDHYRSAENYRTGSDISLVEMGNKVETAAVERL
ncbi:hypothetical protein COCMIDRAFT_36086 [Bipolaris oryzae ATCC 44560]|uniref:Rhodopsin domain-containing protein n=1 Tax=Bipolaris oryzae ATCC 44560 TaxID=930090 RepID=W6Z915_COCMI|nr:uncharacterized protein COCMIDRAFT_36086 [Bipolaris oryzae ATCC 44560]EUC46253.1 hypothetical protein COCMIDRAFT_36086 [Bipolaris oryzae ATCC 44560]